jgi:hypothetical protein
VDRFVHSSHFYADIYDALQSFYCLTFLRLCSLFSFLKRFFTISANYASTVNI